MSDNTNNEYTPSNKDWSGINNLKKFYGFKQNLYLDPAITGYSFVFITRPSLFIYPESSANTNFKDTNKDLAFKNMSSDPRFIMYINGEANNQQDLLIAKQLSYFAADDFSSDVTSSFLPIFTNAIKSFNTSDTSLEYSQNYQTREGYSIYLPTNKTISEGAGSVSLSLDETKNLDITKMLDLWVNYIVNITNGTFTANPDMIDANMLDYTSSIYYFSLEPDGRTIKYWSRYTSCYPTAVPFNVYSYQKGNHDTVQIDVPFQYALKEDMNPRILEDFNLLSLSKVRALYTDSSSYDESQSASGVSYSSFKNNDILNKASLSSNTILSSDDRDPIVFYETISDADNNGKYVLSFSNDTLKDNYATSILGSDKDLSADSIFTLEFLKDKF